MKDYFYKLDPFNFVPVIRTPWGGKDISLLKSKYFQTKNIPIFIGESWEISTDAQFPSMLLNHPKGRRSLRNLLEHEGSKILGQKFNEKYQSQSPLLLKWISAKDVLSVQVHPNNQSQDLKDNECGKHESWFVLSTQAQAFVYLGFKDGLSKEDIIKCLLNNEVEHCLHKYYPKKHDYISVPSGCVHAIGPGVFVIEPQYILPHKAGKTYRIFDWHRLYDEKGLLSAHGKSRELHIQNAIHSIDWTLPRAQELEKLLIHNLNHTECFLGNKINPFAIQSYFHSAKFIHKTLIKNNFSLFNIWAGAATLKYKNKIEHLHAGESAFISAEINEVEVVLSPFKGDVPKAAFFALNDCYL